MITAPQARPAIARVRWGEVIILSSTAALVAGAATLWASWQISPAPVEPMLLHAKALLAKFFLGDILKIHTEIGGRYAYYLSNGGTALIYPRVLAAGTVTFICFIFCCTKLAKRKDPYIHVSGRRLLTDTAATNDLMRQAKEECSIHGGGIKLHPSFPFRLSLDRETRHFLILGSIGGGKTQAIMPLMLAAQERGDRMIIHDTKGDFTSNLPGDPIIIAPWDTRSMSWNIAADCQTKQDARELATRLVPESKDPMWSFAARQILVGFLISLQQQRGQEWGWRDLAALVPLPQPELLLLMAKYNPEGVRAVEEASKTTQSILITLSSYMSIVFDLADAWGDKPVDQRISFLDWLADDTHQQRMLILQNSGRFSGLSRAYIGGIIGLLSSKINSPDFEDSKTRKIWFFLDEFPQLGKLENFSPLLEVGRSKGVRVVIGAQDMAQIQKLYGDEDAQSWASMVGTQIFARINPGETADWVAKLVGDRIVERPNLSVSGSVDLGNGQNATKSYSRESIPVLLPSQLSDELGSKKGGVKCLLLGYKNANMILWPYTTLTKLRPVSRLAAWVGQERPPISEDGSNTDSAPPAPSVLAIHAQQEQVITQPALSDAPPLLAAAVASDNTPEEQTKQKTSGNSSESSSLDDLEQLIGTDVADIPANAGVDAQPSSRKRRIVRKKSIEAERGVD